MGQMAANSSRPGSPWALTIVTVAKFVSTIVATAAETMGGPSFLEYPTRTPLVPTPLYTRYIVNKLRVPLVWRLARTWAERVPGGNPPR